MSSYTYCRTSYVGWISSVIRVITPRAPSPTTAPWKTSPSALRDSFTTSPAEVGVLLARAVRGGAAGSGDGDVGERSQVVQRKTLAVEVWAELAIRDARIDGHRAGGWVERHHLVHRF